MINNRKYTEDVDVAVSLFRPVLKKLRIRDKSKSPESHPPIYLGDEPQLMFIPQIDKICISVTQAQLGNDIYACLLQRQTEVMTDCYIVINEKLYEKSLGDVKMAAIHEFCHFMALVYALTSSSIDRQIDNLRERLDSVIDKLSESSFDNVFISLTKSLSLPNIAESTNEHYRLGYENVAIDYPEMWRCFMFSKELFEEFFNKIEQTNFVTMWHSDDKETRIEAVRMYTRIIDKAADAKSVSHELAEKRAMKWAMDYIQAE